MKSITELSEKLAGLYEGLASGTIDMKLATELNNTAGKLISAHKVQLAYHALRGESPVIPFLAGNTRIQKPVLKEVTGNVGSVPIERSPWAGEVTVHKLQD